MTSDVLFATEATCDVPSTINYCQLYAHVIRASEAKVMKTSVQTIITDYLSPDLLAVLLPTMNFK